MIHFASREGYMEELRAKSDLAAAELALLPAQPGPQGDELLRMATMCRKRKADA